MKYDIVQCNTVETKSKRIIEAYLNLPANAWCIQKLSVEDSIAILVGFISDNSPSKIKAIPRLENDKCNLFEILKYDRTVGYVDITNDAEVIRHVIRMQKIVMEHTIDVPGELYGLGEMINCLGDDTTFINTILFADTVGDIHAKAKYDIENLWKEFLVDFTNFQKEVPFAIAA